MTRRDPLLGLRHMLDAAREAVDAASGLTVADLEADRLRQLRQLEAALSELAGTT